MAAPAAPVFVTLASMAATPAAAAAAASLTLALSKVILHEARSSVASNAQTARLTELVSEESPAGKDRQQRHCFVLGQNNWSAHDRALECVL